MIDLERFSSGDRAYHGELTKTYGKMVLGIARAYTRDFDCAQDLFQEIWIRVFEKRETFKGRGSIRGWLHRLATNYCRNEFKARRIQQRVLERAKQSQLVDIELGSSETPDGDEEERDERLRRRLRNLHAAMAQLSDREFEAIQLRSFKKLPPDLIAEKMGIKKASVRSIIRHGMKRLKKLIEGMEDDLPED